MRDHSGDSATLMRVALKPADAFELVMADGSLANSDVVGALGARAQEVLARGVVRRYADRAVVFQAGEEGGSLFIVLAGEVQLLGRRDSDSVEFGAVHKGGVFGEGEVLAGIRVRCSSALARGEADLVEIDRDALLQGGAMPPRLLEVLGEVHRARQRTLDEMSDFLNRW